ncbi:hypothetical protein BC834DRAFT_972559 [Gloeopeniophorella convolvens]|nr:hypothetical protein BC834DRAFT_972559 [Gloeopeniophorella convolvens]
MAAPVASSSRRPLSTMSRAGPPPQSRRSSDFFKSRLPADPFSNAAFRQRDPVVLNAERLFHASTVQPRRDVILVLGAPTAKELAPLLNSELLAFSLVIIASHQPPSIPSKVQPAVRILRLSEPLGLEQAGAIRFVNILEWAERVARLWRKVGGIGIREFAESEQEGLGALAPPPGFLRQHSKSNPPSPASSTLHLDSMASSAPANSSTSNLRFLRKLTDRSERSLPSPDPSQRPFDALVNFLPSGISDKSLLKQAILVTTISRPFLVAAIPPSSVPPVRAANSRRGSLFKRASVLSFYSMPPTPPLSSGDSLNSLVTGTPFSPGPPIKSHLVHLLPPRPRNATANRVLHSIESFLLSFSFPPSLEVKSADGLEPARTCLLDAPAFGEPVGAPPSLNINWTVADVVLSGCLDDESAPRTWLSGAADIVVATTPPPPMPSVPPAARLDARASSYIPPSHGRRFPQQLGANLLPTPPDSEEDASERKMLGIEPPKRERRNSRWKFWRRRTASPAH